MSLGYIPKIYNAEIPVVRSPFPVEALNTSVR